MRIAAALLVALLTIALTTPAHAWQSVRTGQRNFERAWSLYTSRQPDKAQRFFDISAAAFAEALAQKPLARTMRFASNQTQAGVSLYMAGRYQATLSVMDLAFAQIDRIWEAPLYSAMAHARLGDDERTLAALQRYLDAAPGQSTLSEAVVRQMTVLERGGADLAAVADALEQGAFSQFLTNTGFTREPISVRDRCSGDFWWRYSRRPCTNRVLQINP